MSGALVLVTGASGFIAGHCVKELAAAGYRVRGTVRSTSDEKLVKHLKEMCSSIEFVKADLLQDEGWDAAVAGCDYVLHVASPFFLGDDESKLVKPAVEGTKRVLGAAARAGVKRVVLTSSCASIAYGRKDPPSYVYTDKDWSDPAGCDTYSRSKTLAERAAWDLHKALPDGQKFELVTINPALVQGPFLSSKDCFSGENIMKMLKGELPMVPLIGLGIVDVRDVAAAHVRALTAPNAPGNRYILAADSMFMTEIAGIVAEKYKPLGYKVGTKKAPYWLLWIVSFFDKQVRSILSNLGTKPLFDNSRTKADLGIQFRTPKEAILASAETLIELGVVAPPKKK